MLFSRIVGFSMMRVGICRCVFGRCVIMGVVKMMKIVDL